MKKYVSMDIGGTAIKYGLLDEEGRILQKSQRDTEAWKGGPAILEKALEIVREYEKEHQLSGVCISTAGMVDTQEGRIFYAAPLIPNYAGTNFKEAFQKELGLPCEVENDVNCAGLAEAVSGAAQGSQIALMLTVGTGIGGCLILNGEVYHGYSGSACEVGYMHLEDSDFQTLGAASILTQKVAARKGAAPEQWDGRRIFEAAGNGDPVCRKAIEEMAEVLGKGIANVCYVLNPQTVVLGGGIMAREEYLKPLIEKAVRKYLVSGIAEKTQIVFARHRNDAGILGAFYHFKKKAEVK